MDLEYLRKLHNCHIELSQAPEDKMKSIITLENKDMLLIIEI